MTMSTTDHVSKAASIRDVLLVSTACALVAGTIEVVSIGVDQAGGLQLLGPDYGVLLPEELLPVPKFVLLNRELTNAMQNGAILPYYQPKISLLTGQVVGLEALMKDLAGSSSGSRRVGRREPGSTFGWVPAGSAGRSRGSDPGSQSRRGSSGVSGSVTASARSSGRTRRCGRR